VHIPTPLQFPHVVHILQHPKSPRAGNKLALPLPPFPALSHLFWVFSGLNGGRDPEGCNDSEVTGFDRPIKQVKRAHRTHLREEVEQTKIGGDVRG
jgi:hypothetical protein